jgi:uroporphyrinogen-III decarboxylase
VRHSAKPLVTRIGFVAELLVFWGGGVDTQKTLPFGTPEQVQAEVRQRMQTFGKGGGFVFNTIHNVQASVPSENLLALYRTVDQTRRYPLV